MQFRLPRALALIVMSSSLTAAISGCGAPNFSAMKPTVTKPSAAVLLVNHPMGWTKSLLQQMQQSNSALNILTMKTINTSTKQLPAEVQSLLGKNSPSLVIEVFNGEVPTDALSVAKKHLNVRFEFLGTSSSVPHGVNAAVITTEAQLTAYMTGWLAGFTNQEQGNHVVGWLNNSGGKPDRKTVEALLAGLYAADPTTIMVTAGFNSMRTGAAGTLTNAVPSNATNTTSGSTSNAVATPGGGTVLNSGYVPAVCVEADPLSQANAQLLSSKHSEVFSTAPASGPVVSLPAPPGPTAVQPDLTALVKHSWASGARTNSKNITVWMDAKKVSATAKASLQNLEETGLTTAEVRSGWTSIPQTKRQQWQQLLGF